MNERIPNNEEHPKKKSNLNLTLVSLAAAVGGGAAALGLEEFRDGEKSEEPAISSVPSAPLASGNPQNMETVRVKLGGEEVAVIEVPKSESGIDDE